MKSDSFNLLFCGDFAPCRRFEDIVVEKKDKIFGDLLSVIRKADVSFVNLECPLTTYGSSIRKSGPSLKADPDCVYALKFFSLIGLANNHIMDFGKDGLQSTLEACESIGVPTTGAGVNIKEAKKHHITTVGNLSVAVIAIAEYEFNQAGENAGGSASVDVIDNYHQIMLAKKQADIVIVTLHGGNEYFPYPRPGLRKLCKHYIDLGVEAVVCHHPHVPGAYEYYKGKPIFYSLGNLIFDNPNPPKHWDLGYMVNIEINKEKKQISNVKLLPYRQSVELGGSKLLVDEEKERFLKQIENHRETLDDKKKYQKEWHKFVKYKTNSYLLMQYFPFLFKGLGFISRNTRFTKLFVNKSNILAKLNILRCQSHHEVLESILQDQVSNGYVASKK